MELFVKLRIYVCGGQCLSKEYNGCKGLWVITGSVLKLAPQLFLFMNKKLVSISLGMHSGPKFHLAGSKSRTQAALVFIYSPKQSIVSGEPGLLLQLVAKVKQLSDVLPKKSSLTQGQLPQYTK